MLKSPTPTPNGDIVIHKPGAPSFMTVLNGTMDWLGTHAATVGRVLAILIVGGITMKIFNKLPKSVLIPLVVLAGIATGILSFNIK